MFSCIFVQGPQVYILMEVRVLEHSIGHTLCMTNAVFQYPYFHEYT